MKRHKKDFEWAVVVTCQGNPFYYRYSNLLSAMFAYAWHYLKKRKYNTMNFALTQEFSHRKWRNDKMNK